MRRARPADVTRVLRFVREHAKVAWPGLATPPSATHHLVMCDYVARALAQGMESTYINNNNSILGQLTHGHLIPN